MDILRHVHSGIWTNYEDDLFSNDSFITLPKQINSCSLFPECQGLKDDLVNPIDGTRKELLILEAPIELTYIKAPFVKGLSFNILPVFLPLYIILLRFIEKIPNEPVVVDLRSDKFRNV